MYQPRIAVLIMAGLGCLAVSCGPKAATDQALATDIQAKLYANDATRASNVKVEVKDATVTLSGDVPSSDVELQAMKIANATTGVKSVTDQMKVNASLGSTPPAPADATPSTAAPAQPAPTTPASTTAVPPTGPPTPVASAGPPPAPETKPVRREPRTVTIAAGERLSVRMIDGIDTKTNTEGQTFRASLDAPLTSRNRVIVRAGAPVTVLLASAKGAGRIKGRSELELRVTSLEYHGEQVPVNSSVYAAQGNARGKQTAVRSGIGAAAGAVIGAIAGGGKGAAIGSLAGGGAGAGFQLATHGEQVKVPSETQLTFRLEAPLTFTVER
ncbi:MAG TPA: BON domain-containing protein [Bryobacteraceae bacterium]